MSVDRHCLSRTLALIAIAMIAAVGPLLASSATTADPASRDGSGWLGVSVQEISEGIREATGLDADGGVLVNEVFEGSPAEESGLETGDVIVALDGIDVEGLKQFVHLVRDGLPGDAVDLTLLREGKERTVTAELGEHPEEEEHVLKFFGEGGPRAFEFHGPGASAFCLPGLSGSRIAVRVQDLNPQLSEALGLSGNEGALVIEADEDGPAFAAGIRGGDVIVRVDGQPVADTGELRSIIREKEEGAEVDVTVVRDRKEKTYHVTVEEGPLSSIRRRIEIRGEDLGDALEGLEDLDIDLDLAELGELPGLEALQDLNIDISSDVEERLADLQSQLKELREELEKVRKRQR